MPRLSQQTLELIAAANDVVDVIGSYFPLKRAGAMFKALCPFHQENSPSFTVNPHRQIFKCFGCGAGGSVFKFVEMYEHVSFPEAARKLAERGGVQIVEEEFSEQEDREQSLRKRLLALHGETAEWFHRNLMRTDSGATARDYLKGRGVTSDVAKSWKIGYAPEEWDALGSWARGRGYGREELIASGLVKTKDAEESADDSHPYDRFRGRVMFPICNDYGEVVAFSGRVLEGDAQAAKYLNSPETVLFTKGNILFGLHKSKRALIEKGSAIVCEGQLDLISAFEAGVQNVIAPQGTAFTEKQARILKRFVGEVVLCFDSDAAGQKAAERSLASLLEADLLVRVAELPGGHDPDSLIRSEGAEAFKALIERAPDFFDFQIDRQSRTPEFATARGKAQFARKIGEWVALLSDAVMRDVVVNKVASRLGIAAADFRALVKSPKKSAPAEISPVVSPLKLTPGISLLCHVAMRDAKSLSWLREQPWREVLTSNPDSELLVKILGAGLSPTDAHSVAAFIGTLTESEAAAAASLLDSKAIPNPEVVAREAWLDLERGEIKRRQDQVKSRLAQSGVTSEEIQRVQEEVAELERIKLLRQKEEIERRLREENLSKAAVSELGKEVLDLANRLTHIARPFSSDL